MTSLSISGV
jgi:C1A family cysteine protease